jgi:hypothetical protein
MSLILYAVLVVLILFSLVLLLPFLAPLRSSLLPLFSYLTIPSYIVLALSSVLFFSSYLDLTRHRALASTASRSGVDYFSHSQRQTEAERDCVLSLAVLGLVVFIGRLSSILRHHHTLNNKFIAMEKQAKGAAAAYLTTLPPSSAASTPTTTTTLPSTTTSSSTAAASVSVEGLKVENAKLMAKVTALERQARAASDAFLSSERVKGGDASQQVEVLKTQINQLVQENKRLKTALDDYELVLGDTRKKKL